MIGVYINHFQLKLVSACEQVTGTAYSSAPGLIESGRKYKETFRSPSRLIHGESLPHVEH
jgi:hypothetical protein